MLRYAQTYTCCNIFVLIISISTSVLASDKLWNEREDWQRVDVSSGRPVVTAFNPADDIFQPLDSFAERPLTFLTQDEVLAGKPERMIWINSSESIIRQDSRSITFKVPTEPQTTSLEATTFYEKQLINGIELKPDRYTGFLLFKNNRPHPPVFSKGAACLARKGTEYNQPVFIIDMARTVPADYVAQYIKQNARAGFKDANPEAGVWMGIKWERASERSLERGRYGAAVWYNERIYDARPIGRGRVDDGSACRVFNAIAVADITAFYAKLKSKE